MMVCIQWKTGMYQYDKKKIKQIYTTLFCILSNISLLSDYECHGNFADYIVSISLRILLIWVFS